MEETGANYDGPLTPLGIRLAVGQVWREVDPRFTRLIYITGWYAGRVTFESKGRKSSALISRFNGKRGGYEPRNGQL